MPRKARVPDPTQHARFVFKGTVRRLRASTVREVPATNQTAVVRVEDIVHAPEALSDHLGQDITVLVPRAGALKVGQEAVFYATGGIFGDGVAVLCADHRPAERVPAAMAAATARVSPARQLASRDAQARFQQADLVVSGTVVAVTLPTRPPRGRAGAAAMAPMTTTPGDMPVVSEHDPVMRDAEVEVAAVHKGSHRGGTVSVRFPASIDVKWYLAPKFHVGQEGFFLLHKDEQTKSAPGVVGAAAVAVAADVPAVAYTALHPADFESFDAPGEIRDLAVPSTPPTP